MILKLTWCGNNFEVTEVEWQRDAEVLNAFVDDWKDIYIVDGDNKVKLGEGARTLISEDNEFNDLLQASLDNVKRLPGDLELGVNGITDKLDKLIKDIKNG